MPRDRHASPALRRRTGGGTGTRAGAPLSLGAPRRSRLTRGTIGSTIRGRQPAVPRVPRRPPAAPITRPERFQPVMQSTIVTKAEKAHRYAQEPDRLRISALEATFEAGGGTHVIRLGEGGWTCDCDFWDPAGCAPTSRPPPGCWTCTWWRPPSRAWWTCSRGPDRSDRLAERAPASPAARPRRRVRAPQAVSPAPGPRRPPSTAPPGPARASAGGVAPLPGRPWRRSIQTVVMPSRLAGTWSWNRLCATCRIRSRGEPDALERDLEVARARLVGADLLGGDDVVERHAQPRGSRPRTGRRRSW